MEKFLWESSCMDEEEYELLENDEEVGLSLSNWEIIDVSDSDLEMHFSMEEDLVEQQQKEDQEHNDGGNHETTSRISLIHKPVITCVDELGKIHHHLDLIHCLDLKYHDRSDVNYDEDDVDDDDDDDDDDDEGYDLDDELVPWSVSDKFGRQRMRKLGKRTFSKMYNSKRCPYLYVRPGCVRGKHGLGLKHSC